jgi:short chain dehydrogenase
MARVFITGSADGLGQAVAQTLLNDGHEVVVHARNRDRLTAVRDLLDRGAAAVVGDLSDLEETRGLARDVNRLGRLEAVIHNAGVYTGPHVLPVNVVAPYLLTALIDRPQRLVYLSSSEHRSGRPSLTASTGAAAAQLGPIRTASSLSPRSPLPSPGDGRRCSATRWTLAGCPPRWADPGAPDNLRLGHLTQELLATSEDPEAHLRRLLVSPAPDRAASRRP